MSAVQLGTPGSDWKAVTGHAIHGTTVSRIS